MAYDIFKGKTSRDWSCGSLILPAKQQAALINKIDDVRYDVRRSSKLIQIGMLALSGAVALVAVSNLHRTASGR
jgi:hypothetical protein